MIKKIVYECVANGITLLVLLALGLLMALLTGCGHNAVQYSDGLGFDAGINPENFTFSFNLRYGKIYSAVYKEKSKVSLTTAVATEVGDQGKTVLREETKLSAESADQVTGYVVDLERAKREK